MRPTDFALESETDVRGLVLAYRFMHVQSSRIISAYAQTLGIGSTDLRAMMHTAIAGTTSPTRLADYLELSTGATTTVVDRLVAAGYLARARHPSDRRGIVVEITDEGRTAFERFFATYDATLAEMIPADRWAKFGALFRRMGETFAATRDRILAAPTEA